MTPLKLHCLLSSPSQTSLGLCVKPCLKPCKLATDAFHYIFLMKVPAWYHPPKRPSLFIVMEQYISEFLATGITLWIFPLWRKKDIFVHVYTIGDSTKLHSRTATHFPRCLQLFNYSKMLTCSPGLISTGGKIYLRLSPSQDQGGQSLTPPLATTNTW